MLNRLRPARAGDLEEVRRLLAACGLPTAGVAESLEDGYVVVEDGPDEDGEPGRELIGVCGVEVYGPYGLLRSLAVDPARRDRATGRALVEDRLDWARARGLREVYLLTTDAELYFERFGFLRRSRDGAPPEIAGCPEFRSLCPKTAVVMSIPLDNRGRP